MLSMTATELLHSGPLFKAFSTDSTDPSWDIDAATEWCLEFPDAVVSLQGDRWYIDGEPQDD